jgi:hypothetical protein
MHSEDVVRSFSLAQSDPLVALLSIGDKALSYTGGLQRRKVK